MQIAILLSSVYEEYNKMTQFYGCEKLLSYQLINYRTKKEMDKETRTLFPFPINNNHVEKKKNER